MKKVWTTENARKIQNKLIYSVIIFMVIFVILIFIFLLLPKSLFKEISIVSIVGSFVYLCYCSVLYFSIIKKIDEISGEKLRIDLGIQKLSFFKLNDGSYEMHHKLYSKNQMDEMILGGMTSNEIIQQWEDRLVIDFKRLEWFMKSRKFEGEHIVLHTYTHVKMYRIWSKIAQNVGIEFEIMKNNNQKPVGFKWITWKDAVYRTSGKIATKDSMPKGFEWDKYFLTLKP